MPNSQPDYRTQVTDTTGSPVLKLLEEKITFRALLDGSRKSESYFPE